MSNNPFVNEQLEDMAGALQRIADAVETVAKGAQVTPEAFVEAVMQMPLPKLRDLAEIKEDVPRPKCLDDERKMDWKPNAVFLEWLLVSSDVPDTVGGLSTEPFLDGVRFALGLEPVCNSNIELLKLIGWTK